MLQNILKKFKSTILCMSTYTSIPLLSVGLLPGKCIYYHNATLGDKPLLLPSKSKQRLISNRSAVGLPPPTKIPYRGWTSSDATDSLFQVSIQPTSPGANSSVSSYHSSAHPWHPSEEGEGAGEPCIVHWFSLLILRKDDEQCIFMYLFKHFFNHLTPIVSKWLTKLQYKYIYINQLKPWNQIQMPARIKKSSVSTRNSIKRDLSELSWKRFP